MQHRVLASQAGDAECKVFDYRARRLTMDEVSVCQRILQHRDNGVTVVRRLGPNILEHEG